MSCLLNDDVVCSAHLGEEGIFSNTDGRVVLEMSTISPETSCKLHADGARHGISVMDIAISGRPAVEQCTIVLQLR